MAQSISQKLKIKEGTKILLVNPPMGIEKSISPLPKGASFVSKSKNHEFVILFVKNKKEMTKLFTATLKLLDKGGLIWTAFPKGSSGIQTDLTRDTGWEVLQKYDLEWKTLISLDDTWSAFCLQNSPAKKESSKASEDYHKNTTEWSDSVKKIVKIPKDFEIAMVKGKVKKFFDEQNFTNRKEYVMWIVGAKQEQTRMARIAKAVDKMKKGLRNPTMK
jgi:hypothetical protein